MTTIKPGITSLEIEILDTFEMLNDLRSRLQSRLDAELCPTAVHAGDDEVTAALMELTKSVWALVRILKNRADARLKMIDASSEKNHEECK